MKHLRENIAALLLYSLIVFGNSLYMLRPKFSFLWFAGIFCIVTTYLILLCITYKYIDYTKKECVLSKQDAKEVGG